MIAHRKHPLRPQSLWLVYIGALLATLLLAGCGNSMASTAKGDPGGITTGSKGDVVGQVDGAPVCLRCIGKREHIELVLHARQQRLRGAG